MKKPRWISVKLEGEIVEKVRANKKITGVAVGKYFEIAAREKLEKNESKK